MSLNGKSDDASNTPVVWAQQLKVTANVGNRTALYGNTTANAFIAGVTVGVYAVDSDEIKAANSKIAHTGYVLRTEGSGGRAGRVHYEVLVAGGISTDSEDVVLPDFSIFIDTAPASANVTAPAPAAFGVVARSVPSTTLTYQWQLDSGSGFANVTNGGVYSGSTTANVAISNSTGLTGNKYRVVVSATGATSVTSSNATLTVA